MSADGRFVAFYSFSTNHVTDDTSLAPDVFVRDRALGVTTRDHVRDDGLEAEFAAEHLGMSADGRIVGLQSAAVDLIPSDPGNGVFVRDRGPANGTGRITATVGEGQVAVSGWANFAGVVVSQGADPGTDGVPGAYANGGELTGAGLTTRPESADLLLRWSLAGLPPAAAGVLYGFDFALGGTPYQVTAVEPSTFVLSRCTPACTPIATVGGAIGTTGSELHVSVPVAALGGVAGMQLTGVRAFTALGGATLDELSLPAGSVPTPSVALGIAGDGVPESGVAFESPASLSSGYFSGTVSTAGLPGGDYRVWARACLGATCQAASAPVTLTGTVAVEPGPAGGPAFSTLSVAGAHPLRHVASLQYAIGRDAAGGGPVEVMLELHDLQGRRLHTLKRGRVGVGRYRVIWDLRGPSGALMAPGVYYARLRAGAVERVTKLVVIE